MADFRPVFALEDLTAPFEMDWFNNRPPGSRTKLRSGDAVSPALDYYKPESGRQQLTGITVRGTGPGINVRRCSVNDLAAGFWSGEGLLAAPGANHSPGGNNALITLQFSTPLVSLGAYVSGTKANLVGTGFSALLWIQLSEEADWALPVSAAGLLSDPVVATGTPPMPLPDAPFLGARALDGATIAAAGFDVSLIGNASLDLAAISRLYFTVL